MRLSEGVERAVNELAAAIARSVFKTRGNHSEVRLTERELTDVAALAYKLGLEDGRRSAGVTT